MYRCEPIRVYMCVCVRMQMMTGTVYKVKNLKLTTNYFKTLRKHFCEVVRIFDDYILVEDL